MKTARRYLIPVVIFLGLAGGQARTGAAEQERLIDTKVEKV